MDSGIGTNWAERSKQLRERIAEILTFPDERVPLAAETHRRLDGDGYTVESVTYASEPGSRVTALLYLPAPLDGGKIPGIVAACGHGGSKSALAYQYAGQLYAKLGFACLVVDTIGEEERHVDGGMGTRAHDLYRFKSSEERRAFCRDELGRMVLGKIVWDLMRGLDHLEARPEVDAARLGIVGNSLGGASAGCVAILDTRVRASLISGWGFVQPLSIYGKDCTRMPYEAFADLMSFDEMTALLAPHAATLFFNGACDTIIDPDEGGAGLVRHVRAGIAGAQRILEDGGVEGTMEGLFVPGACHRPYFLMAPGVAWMQEHLVAPEARKAIPRETVRFGDWVNAQGQAIEKLYDTEARVRGAEAVAIGAVFREPRALACFPDAKSAGPEYTFEGWVEFARAARGGS